MNILRQSTAIVVRIGPFMDATNAVTPETGITLGAADQAEALKANGAATVDISGATWAAVTGAAGWYDLSLTTSHTDTVGELVIVVQDESVCLPVYKTFQVIEEAAYDALFAASAPGYVANAPVNVAQISGDSGAADNCEAFFDGTGYAGTGNVIPTVTTVGTVNGLAANVITATSIAADAITAAKIATGAIDADAIAADAITAAKIANGAIDAATFAAGAIDAAAIADGAIDAATFAGGTLLDEAGVRTALGLTAANLETLITTVDTVVDTIASRLTATRAGYLDNLSGGAVATAAALTVIDDFLDTEIAAILAIAVKLDSALELDGSVYRFTINALEQAPAGGGGGSTDWTADERTAIRAILGIPGSGTTPADPTSGILDTIRDATGTLQTSVNDLPTNAELATALAAADDAVLAAIAALSVPTTAAIADAVLDEVVEGTATVRQLLRGYTAALLNILAGAATTTVTARDMANTKNRITATVDADGNRSAVTLDLT